MDEAIKARNAAKLHLTSQQKNQLLENIANRLQRDKISILEANRKDLIEAKKKGKNAAFLQRLTLSENHIEEMIQGIQTIISLDDPIGKVLSEKTLQNGLLLKKVTVPLGVVLIIYESRPNVTIDVSVICIKSGNCVILKGGSDAGNSNQALFSCIRGALKEENLPEDLVQLMGNDHDEVAELLQRDDLIDVVIPRGGKGLIETVVKNSRIPIIKHFEGVCTIFVDKAADFRKAISIIINAKAQKPSACNAVENLLVHRKIKESFLVLLKEACDKENIELKGCLETRKSIDIALATDEDYRTEYLEKILSIKIVEDVGEAIEFIAMYGSNHSDAIITEDDDVAARFLQAIDSEAVYHNASTRFTDGGCFGMGCEIGISTQKLHARGPMGLEEMTSYKYVILGEGHIRM